MEEENKIEFIKKLHEAKEFATETTKMAGITKGVRELVRYPKTSEEEIYFKPILKYLFRQLITDLYILIDDPYSNLTVHKLLKEFNMHYGGRSKELGLDQAIKKAEKYRNLLKKEVDEWGDIRKKFSAHFDSNFDQKSINVEPDDISSCLKSIIEILNTMDQTISTPEEYPEKIKSVVYVRGNSAINLEDEFYNAVKSKLKWVSKR